MEKSKKIVNIFAADEMNLVEVKSIWSPEELLGKEGIFFLKDIIKVLDLDPAKVKKKAREIREQQKDPWEVMGARKIWNHWIIRMVIFAPYYRQHLISRVRSLKKDWDGNALLRQKGIFFLTEVCRLIPFSAHQIRYQAKRNPNAKIEIGVWKDGELNAFLVDMELFAPWINRLWEGHFKKK